MCLHIYTLTVVETSADIQERVEEFAVGGDQEHISAITAPCCLGYQLTSVQDQAFP